MDSTTSDTQQQPQSTQIPQAKPQQQPIPPNQTLHPPYPPFVVPSQYQQTYNNPSYAYCGYPGYMPSYMAHAPPAHVPSVITSQSQSGMSQPQTSGPLINQNAQPDKSYGHTMQQLNLSSQPVSTTLKREKKLATLKDRKGNIIDLESDNSSQKDPKNPTKSSQDEEVPASTSKVKEQLLEQVSQATVTSSNTDKDNELQNNKSSSQDEEAPSITPEVKEQLLEQVSQATVTSSNTDKDSELQGDQQSGLQNNESSSYKVTTNDNKVNQESSETEASASVVATSTETDQIVPQYLPGQFNPTTNRDGKRHYSIEFLKLIGERNCKFNLSHNDTNYESNADGEYRLPKQDLFAPSYSHRTIGNGPPLRQTQQGYNGRSSSGQDKPRKIIATSASLNQDVELKTTSNPWKPSKEVKETETDLLKRKFRSLLNKLTPNNFAQLSEAVTELNIDTEAKLADVIDIVFAKALAEPGYSVLYGQMCSHLKKKSINEEGKSITNFGNTLLKRCQLQFQADIYAGLNLAEREAKIEQESDPDVKKQLCDELYEDKYRCRMRGLGLIKFIGELYKIEMLNDMIMMDCITRLLADPSEESLECLCDLLVTVGCKLEKDQNQRYQDGKEKRTVKKNPPQSAPKSMASVVASSSPSSQQQQQQQQQPSVITFDQVFEMLCKIRKDRDNQLSQRIRFKILDTIDLREVHKWQSKKVGSDPKKLEEIREAHREKVELERRQGVVARRSQEGNRRALGHAGGSSGQISSLANDRGSSLHTSASSHQILEHSSNDIRGNQNIDSQDFEKHKEVVATFTLKSRDESVGQSLRPSWGRTQKSLNLKK